MVYLFVYRLFTVSPCVLDIELQAFQANWWPVAASRDQRPPGIVPY